MYIVLNSYNHLTTSTILTFCLDVFGQIRSPGPTFGQTRQEIPFLGQKSLSWWWSWGQCLKPKSEQKKRTHRSFELLIVFHQVPKEHSLIVPTIHAYDDNWSDDNDDYDDNWDVKNVQNDVDGDVQANRMVESRGGGKEEGTRP